MLVSRDKTYENLDDIANLLNDIDADIIALQEADGRSRWSGRFDHVEYLVSKTKHDCFVHGRHQHGWLASFGTALLANVTLEKPSSSPFEPSPPTTNKGFVRSAVEWQHNENRITLTIVSLHLDFLNKSVREAQVNEIIDDLSELKSPMVIMGDLNSEWADERSSVRMLAEGLDLTVFSPDGANLGTYKKVTGKRLDWILLSGPLEFVDYRVVPDGVSDHLAVYAEIGYKEDM